MLVSLGEQNSWLRMGGKVQRCGEGAEKGEDGTSELGKTSAFFGVASSQREGQVAAI